MLSDVLGSALSVKLSCATFKSIETYEQGAQCHSADDFCLLLKETESEIII